MTDNIQHLREQRGSELTRGLRERLRESQQRVARVPDPLPEGRLSRMVGMTLEAEGVRLPVGGRAAIHTASGERLLAEVVGFHGEKTFLMPEGKLEGVAPGARIEPLEQARLIGVGPELLGRVIDANGKPLDDLGRIRASDHISIEGRPINPLKRDPVRTPLDVGIRSLNGLLSVGRGQRLGLFAGSGVGKSVLLGMMTRHTEADVIVVGLIGERGREVNEFIHDILDVESRKRTVVVAVPADQPPLLRQHGAWVATAIAEYFRDRGLNVLLLVDSLTRFAQGAREIAMAIGEPPATKGYSASVFARLPQLVERAGNGDKGGGSITAFYTVLAEGDDQNDPIVDAARAILDGHVVLSRAIAERGRYPAIDVGASVSRVMDSLIDDQHRQAAHHYRNLTSTYEMNRDLIAVGAYRQGADPVLDEAVAMRNKLEDYVRQNRTERVTFTEARAQLFGLFGLTEAKAAA
ncbi:MULTISPECIES: FliI/YscN family ATPase [Thiorhodovibrio]|uniref:FliI/YscN family ATPase n=1 Tax=Thiorhodovibrio TaxID=61593 RepID=UPI001913EAB1|nr:MULTISPECIES: FliI/YscN family ATPase [Thiorhodovibrio]MBK5970755.1 flagellum-specific ATP synthase FliI [Thiorhodovibrio winogradskyi]WPL14557.1 Flagellum-specific ATP synthase [Thiorhodovibrio litoralis]